MAAQSQTTTAAGTMRFLAEAQAFFEQRRPHDVIIACDKALQQDPNCALAFYYRGAAHLELGEQTGMHADFDQAVALDPKNAEMLYKIATVMAHVKHHPKAIGLLGRVIELDATAQSAWALLADGYLHVGKVDTASAILAHALEKFPSNTTLQLMQATLMPQIFMSAEEGRQASARFIQNLDALMQEGFKVSDPIAELPFFPFYHAYSGQNCKPLMEKMAAFFLQACPSLAYEAPHCKQPREGKTPLRIGFVTELMHTDTIMMFFAQMLEGLAKDKALEVVLFSISRVPHSGGQAVPKGIEKFMSLPIHLPTIRESIAAEALDVLMYLDIGLGQCAYFAAFSRLAPVQCTWGGHPVTTGIPTMDYYLTAQDAEPQHPEMHYTEKPVLL
ncbi:MAG: hypothetical protein K2Q01_08090, partial [Rickettsiales bacterium]|nr:hypothetical protein [Rickettsiales bacterium]